MVEPDDRYCEVVQIGIDDNTAEVTIFYTPEREFEVSNGYVSESRDVTRNGRRYRKLKIVTSKANLIEVRRYYGTKEYFIDANGQNVYFEKTIVKV